MCIRDRVYGIKNMSVVRLYDHSVKIGRELTDKIIAGEVFNVNEYVEQRKKYYNGTGSDSHTTNKASYNTDDNDNNTYENIGN